MVTSQEQSGAIRGAIRPASSRGWSRRRSNQSQSEAQSDLHRAEDGHVAVAAADHSERGIRAEVRSAGQCSHL